MAPRKSHRNREAILSGKQSFPLPELVDLLAREFDLSRTTIIEMLVEGLAGGLFDEPAAEGDNPIERAQQAGTVDANSESDDIFGAQAARPPARRTGWTRRSEPEPTHPFGDEIYRDDLPFFEDYAPHLIDSGWFSDISVSRAGLIRFFSRRPDLAGPTFLSDIQANSNEESEKPVAQPQKLRFRRDYAVAILKPLNLAKEYPNVRWTTEQLADLLNALTTGIVGVPSAPRTDQRWAGAVCLRLGLSKFKQGGSPSYQEDQAVRAIIAEQNQPSEVAVKIFSRR
jgi:hypothetical protein